MAYEIVSDIADYKNVLLQYQGDKAHFSVFSPASLWDNLAGEATRYKAWFSEKLIFSNTPLTLVHIFQLLSLVALIYLISSMHRSDKTQRCDERIRECAC
jgi:hypothetical protein